MKKIFSLLILAIFFHSCLFTISKQDIETPFDTVRTLQWALSKIEKNDFFNIMYELFVDEGDKIVKQLEGLEQSKKPDEQKLWKKLKEIFKNIIIKLDKLEATENTALTHCSYFFPDNYYITQVKIRMKKTRDGWKITHIDGLNLIAPAQQSQTPAVPVTPSGQNAPATSR